MARAHRRLRGVVPEARPHRRRGQSAGASVGLASLARARAGLAGLTGLTGLTAARARAAAAGPARCGAGLRRVAALPRPALRPRAVYSRVARYPYSLRIV